MNGSIIKVLQEQMLEIMRAQQGAYLAAIKTWQQPSFSAVPPEAAGSQQEAVMMPTSTEIADAAQAFTTRMVEDQRKFLADLKDVTGHDTRTGRTMPDRPARRDPDHYLALCTNRAAHARGHAH